VCRAPAVDSASLLRHPSLIEQPLCGALGADGVLFAPEIRLRKVRRGPGGQALSSVLAKQVAQQMLVGATSSRGSRGTQRPLQQQQDMPHAPPVARSPSVERCERASRSTAQDVVLNTPRAAAPSTAVGRDEQQRRCHDGGALCARQAPRAARLCTAGRAFAGRASSGPRRPCCLASSAVPSSPAIHHAAHPPAHLRRPAALSASAAALPRRARRLPPLHAPRHASRPPLAAREHVPSTSRPPHPPHRRRTSVVRCCSDRSTLASRSPALAVTKPS
jgi:hypothetical protein